jgi:hypothetical protein
MTVIAESSVTQIHVTRLEFKGHAEVKLFLFLFLFLFPIPILCVRAPAHQFQSGFRVYESKAREFEV